MPPRVDLTDEQIERIRDLWERGATHYEICVAVGISVDLLRSRLRDQLKGLPPRPRRSNSGRRGIDPSPEEIEELCRGLQSTWTDEQRLERIVGRPTFKR